MTHQEFINKARECYKASRRCKYQEDTPLSLLSRCTSHTISSEIEDLFAYYCATKVTQPEGVKIIVDPPLSFRGTGLKNKSGKRSLLMRPDVAIINNNKATCFFDIKTDLGYKRFGLADEAKYKNEQLAKVKNIRAFYKDGITKEEHQVIMDSHLQYVYVILSQGNIAEETLNDYKNEIGELENVSFYILSVGHHLNSYEESHRFIPNTQDFNELDVLITRKLYSANTVLI